MQKQEMQNVDYSSFLWVWLWNGGTDLFGKIHAE